MVVINLVVWSSTWCGHPCATEGGEDGGVDWGGKSSQYIKFWLHNSASCYLNGSSSLVSTARAS